MSCSRRLITRNGKLGGGGASISTSSASGRKREFGSAEAEVRRRMERSVKTEGSGSGCKQDGDAGSADADLWGDSSATKVVNGDDFAYDSSMRKGGAVSKKRREPIAPIGLSGRARLDTVSLNSSGPKLSKLIIFLG